jgi:Cu/Ag efflux pump CusA
VFEVVVKGTPETRRSVADIRNLLLDTPSGGGVRLGRVADVRVRDLPISIPRESVSRYLDVSADVTGRSLDSVAGELEDRLASSAFPLEYHAEVLTRTTSSEINLGLVIGSAIAVLIAAFLLIQAATRGWTTAVLVFATLPVALSGGAVAGFIAGEFSLGSLAAFLGLFAIAARHGLLEIRHMQDLERYEAEAFGPALVARGARERLAPTLASVIGLAVVALVFVVLGPRPGLEVVNPMAIVLLGGLVTTALASMFMLPTLYLRFGGRQPTLSPEEELMQRWAGIEPAPAGAAAGAKAVPVDGEPPAMPREPIRGTATAADEVKDVPDE